MIWQAEADLRFKMVGGGVYVPGAKGAGTTFGGAPTLLTFVLGVTEHGGRAPSQTPKSCSRNGGISSVGRSTTS